MSKKSSNFRIGKSIEEIMLERSLEKDSLPPVRTAKQLQKTINRVNKAQNGSALLSRSTNNLSEGKYLGQSPSSPSYENLIMESLMEHCRTLQARVQDLESKLKYAEDEKKSCLYDLQNMREMLQEKDSALMALGDQSPHSLKREIPTPLITAARQNYNKPRTAKGTSTPNTRSGSATGSVDPISEALRTDLSRPMSRQENEEAVVHTVGDMDSKIRELRLIFHPADPIEERTKATIKIGAIVRGWLSRQRYSKYRNALRNFKFGRVNRFLNLIETNLTIAGSIESGVRSIVMKRNTLLIEKIFERWSYICRQTAPFRRANILAAENKYQVKRLELLELTFSAFRRGTIGGDSHKQLRQERRLMVERIRKNIMERNSNTEGKKNMIVTDMEIKREIRQEIVKSSIERRNDRQKKKIFLVFKSDYLKSVNSDKVAHRHSFRKYAGKCFYAWSDWTYAVGSGLERKRWPGPRRYEVRYNPKLVEHFVKVRLKKMTFMPWKRFARTQAIVNMRFAKKLTKFVRDTFEAWRALIKHFQVLRADAVKMWLGYAADITRGPFMAWKDMAANAVLLRNQQNRLVNAYLRWKRRQKNIRILQTWRHQALYGGVEGMYSRTTISKSLGEQKSMCASLQKMISRQTVELEECKELVNREIRLRKKMEDAVVDKDSEIERLKLKGHHVDQELRRLTGIIEAMATINPAQISLLKKMQPDFNFQERKIQPSLEGKDENMVDDEEGEVEDDKSSAVGFAEQSMSDVLGLDDNNQSTDPHGGESHHRSSLRQGTDEKSSQPKKEPRLSLNASSSLPDISHDDRRLLLRVKWVVRTLFPEVDPYEHEKGKITPAKREELYEHDDFENEQEKTKPINSFMSKGEMETEKKVQAMLQDPTDTSEMSFLLKILSFLRDGSTKFFTKTDSRDWAKMLLKSVGRDTEIINTLIPDEDKISKEDSDAVQKSESINDWRSVLIHLQTFYPVGKAGRMANVDFDDDKNAAFRGVLTRARTMRKELKEVLKYKIDKTSRSKIGKGIASNLTISGKALLCNLMLGIITSADNMSQEERENLYNTYDDNNPGINMYAGNLANQIGCDEESPNNEQELDLEKAFDEEETTLSGYNPNAQSHLLKMHNEIMKHVTDDNGSTYSSEFTLPSTKNTEKL